MPDVTPIVLQQIDLDIVPGKIPPIVHVSEYDTGRQILVNLFRDGYPFGSDSIESYTVKVEGSIGKYGFSENADWADDAAGVVVINLTEAMTAIHGRVWAKIKLIKSESMQISTCGFWMDVDRAGVKAETVIGAPGFQEQINEGIAEYFDNDPPFFELPPGGHRGQSLLSDGDNGAYWGTPAGSGGGGSVPENITNILLKIHEILSYAVYTQDVTGDLSTLLDMINSGGGGGDDSDENVYQIGSTLYIISDVNAVKYGSALTLS